MTTLEIAIAKIKRLPIEQRNQVLEFIEFLESKLGKISHIQEQIETDEKEVSFTEAAQEFIGCLDSNLEDLSYNPKYMEGFSK
jgi:hypothetical protein